jgi:hypothetical protein
MWRWRPGYRLAVELLVIGRKTIMNNFKSRSIFVLSALLLIIAFLSGYSQSTTTIKKVEQRNYTTTFNSRWNDKVLLLGCMLYSKSLSKKADYYDRDSFLDLSSKFSEKLNSGKNIGNVIDDYLSQNSSIDFKSEKAIHKISLFIENYNLVTNVIFAEVSSDENVVAMDKVKGKIFMIPALKKIYQSYLEGRPDMSSLSSNEGDALYIQIAYYLSFQNVSQRNQLLKTLL